MTRPMLQACSSSRGKARIGVITPYSNTNLEADLALLRPSGVSWHVARAGGYDLDKIPDSGQMRQFARAGLDDALSLLLAVRPNIILYGCTSATLSMGYDFDRAFSNEVAERAGVPVVTAAGAVVEALHDISVHRVGFCSPYVESLNQESVRFLKSAGIDVVNVAGVDRELGNYGQGALEPHDVLELGLRADHANAEAIVLSCTDMRAVEVIEILEETTGKPVITSNQALAHAAITRLELTDAVPGWLGRSRKSGQVSPGASDMIVKA